MLCRLICCGRSWFCGAPSQIKLRVENPAITKKTPWLDLSREFCEPLLQCCSTQLISLWFWLKKMNCVFDHPLYPGKPGVPHFDWLCCSRVKPLQDFSKVWHFSKTLKKSREGDHHRDVFSASQTVGRCRLSERQCCLLVMSRVTTQSAATSVQI